MNIPALFLTVASVLNLVFISGMILLTDYTDVYGRYETLVVIGTIAVTILSAFIQLIIMGNYVELIKKINPEKKINFLDKNFEKNWEKNCDEGEKHMMYKAAYTAFKAANICCMILWAVCLFLQITFSIGILPVLCVSAVWLTLIISFFVQNNKHSK